MELSENRKLSLIVFFLRSADARAVLIGIRDAERWAVWNFGCWKNDAAVVVVRFKFEGGELAFEIAFSGFLVDEENLGST